MEQSIFPPDLSVGSLDNFEPATQQHQPKTLREIAAKGCVLVIDEDQPVLDLMTRFLHPYGIEVHGYTNPAAALSWFESNWGSIALVFLDMRNPHMDGEQCFAFLQSINADVRIALLSGQEHGAIVEELPDEGALRSFSKPFDYPALVSWALRTGMGES